MPERDHFHGWVIESAFADEELTIQVAAYLQTFPGRMLQLIVELLEAPFLKQEQTNESGDSKEQHRAIPPPGDQAW